ncbi:2-deoxyglucose-6-phosphate phosphatase 1 [Rhodotorula toruloides]|nr:2-deoxyglucose-6-phosphate phosphatase 1 [Rhodotorula toruloides]
MPVEITVKGLLFDMDGTLVDSTPAVEKTMGDWCHEQGIEPSEFFQHSHGVRTQDNIKRFQRVPVPGTSLSEEELVDSVNKLEWLIAENGRLMHEAGGKGIERLPGAKDLLDALRAGGARWGICTSGEPSGLLRSLLATVAELLIAATRTYASSALKTGEIGAEPPALPFLVTANDVTHGKPHPEPYLKGLDELRQLPGAAFEPSDILVVEDAPSGLKSGLAAGCKTLGVATGQPLERFRTFEATVKTMDLTRVEVVSASPDAVTLRIKTLEEEESEKTNGTA